MCRFCPTAFDIQMFMKTSTAINIIVYQIARLSLSIVIDKVLNMNSMIKPINIIF